MKHPVWILNSGLLVLLVLTACVMFFSRQNPPAREEIEPSGAIKPLKGEVSQVDIAQIYEHDLFGTYQKELPTYEASAITIPSIPPPPVPKAVTVPPVPAPQFLEPLGITLKGIIIMINDDSKNRAIIADNKTNQETVYKAGNMIEDAQLIRIANNKIVIVRSNGQQEVLYLREKDAKLDPAYMSSGEWQDVIQKVSDTEFVVSPSEFVARVKNLAQFIDMLDLITVYKQGKSIGCRIGSSADNSLGTALGLQSSDVIVSINDTPATTTADRFKIYKEIIGLQQHEVIKVKILRQQQEIVLQFTLKNFKQHELQAGKTGETKVEMQPTSNQLKDEQLRSLQQRHTLAPTIEEIRAKERANMFKKGKSSAAKHATGGVE